MGSFHLWACHRSVNQRGTGFFGQKSQKRESHFFGNPGKGATSGFNQIKVDWAWLKKVRLTCWEPVLVIARPIFHSSKWVSFVCSLDLIPNISFLSLVEDSRIHRLETKLVSLEKNSWPVSKLQKCGLVPARKVKFGTRDKKMLQLIFFIPFRKSRWAFGKNKTKQKQKQMSDQRMSHRFAAYIFLFDQIWSRWLLQQFNFGASGKRMIRGRNWYIKPLKRLTRNFQS